MRNPKYLYWSIAFLLAYFTLATLTGCYTQKKAQEQVNKANDKYPEVVAKVARDLYPCTDLLKPDTLTVYQDSLVYIDCPETTDIITFIDTINSRVPVPGKTIRVPVNVPIRTQIVTKWYEDSAKLKLSALALTKSAQEIADLKQQLTTMTGKRNFFRKWFWILVIAIGVFVIIKLVIK